MANIFTLSAMSRGLLLLMLVCLSVTTQAQPAPTTPSGNPFFTVRVGNPPRYDVTFEVRLHGERLAFDAYGITNHPATPPAGNPWRIALERKPPAYQRLRRFEVRPPGSKTAYDRLEFKFDDSRLLHVTEVRVVLNGKPTPLNLTWDASFHQQRLKSVRYGDQVINLSNSPGGQPSRVVGESRTPNVAVVISTPD